jgi:hypothetical protein
MSRQRKELRVSKISFIPKVFSASERAAWDKMWDMLLTKPPEQLREDDQQIRGLGISKKGSGSASKPR